MELGRKFKAIGRSEPGKGAGGRIRFTTYSYTVTRVRVMKSRLLREEDYMRMRKMGLNEMIRFLEESEHKGEIDSLSKRYRGAELVELAMNESLANVVNKLLRISLKEELKFIIEFYSEKWILNNVKLVLRTKMNRLGEDDLKYGIVPIKPTGYEACLRLYRESGEGFLEEISAITHIDAARLGELYRANDLVGLENEIDVSFYRRLMALKRRIRMGPNDPLKQFFEHLIYLMNIKNIVRFKNEGLDEDTIRKMIVMEPSGRLAVRERGLAGRKGRRLMEGIIRAKDVKTVFERLKQSPYKDLVTAEVEQTPSRLEGSIEKFLLMYASKLLHRKPLSVSPIFGYLLWKEIETKNLKLLVHAKAMGLDEKFVDANLIVVDDSVLKVMKNA